MVDVVEPVVEDVADLPARLAARIALLPALRDRVRPGGTHSPRGPHLCWVIRRHGLAWERVVEHDLPVMSWRGWLQGQEAAGGELVLELDLGGASEGDVPGAAARAGVE